MLLLLLGCALRSSAGPESARDRALAEAEARWANRAMPGELDAAVDLWRDVLALDPDHPVALARLARAEWTRGQLDAAAALPHFETGQDYGWRCLLAWPAFSAALAADRYSVTEVAAAELPAAAAPCLLWTAIDGLALIGHRGPGASLELGDVGVLLARVETLAGEVPEGGALALEPGFLPWARARYLVLSVAPDAPPGEARGHFAEAIASAPGVRLFRQDLGAAFPDAQNLAYEGYAPPSPDPWGLENGAWTPE